MQDSQNESGRRESGNKGARSNQQPEGRVWRGRRTVNNHERKRYRESRKSKINGKKESFAGPLASREERERQK
jgi:hypothetical protein